MTRAVADLVRSAGRHIKTLARIAPAGEECPALERRLVRLISERPTRPLVRRCTVSRAVVVPERGDVLALPG